MEKLHSKNTVVISGGLGDIGKAIALEFAREGASIGICDLKELETALPFIEDLKRIGVKATYSRVDVTDDNAVRAWIEGVEKELGTPDIIILNSAIVTIAGAMEISSRQWTNELNVNLNGAFFVAQAASKALLKSRKPGRILFIGSWAGQVPQAAIPAYSVSKAGITMLCKCMALELAPHQILVNEIAPGFVRAGLSLQVWDKDPTSFAVAEERVPVKKIMTAGEVAAQVVRLCHPGNVHTTGSNFLMDGGLSLR